MELLSEKDNPTDSADFGQPLQLLTQPSPSAKQSNVPGNTTKLSKNKLRKQRHYEQSLEHCKQRRAKEREVRKQRGQKKRRGNNEKQAEIEKLRNAMKIGHRLVIDCQYQSCMSVKELTRFARQLRRVYSSNRSAASPLHIYLTSLSQDNDLFKICCKQNEGFANYVLDISEKPVLKLFEPSEVVYLTPDASNVISLDKGFEQGKVYVVGGIVDETTTKNLSHGFAQTTKLSCARLPIDEFFERGDKGTFKKVLTVNQVVDIILEWHNTKDWVTAISKGLPERTGFRPRPKPITTLK